MDNGTGLSRRGRRGAESRLCVPNSGGHFCVSSKEFPPWGVGVAVSTCARENQDVPALYAGGRLYKCAE